LASWLDGGPCVLDFLARRSGILPADGRQPQNCGCQWRFLAFNPGEHESGTRRNRDEERNYRLIVTSKMIAQTCGDLVRILRLLFANHAGSSATKVGALSASRSTRIKRSSESLRPHRIFDKSSGVVAYKLVHSTHLLS
jgi:hypothetical protein